MIARSSALLIATIACADGWGCSDRTPAAPASTMAAADTHMTGQAADAQALDSDATAPSDAAPPPASRGAADSGSSSACQIDMVPADTAAVGGVSLSNALFRLGSLTGGTLVFHSAAESFSTLGTLEHRGLDQTKQAFLQRPAPGTDACTTAVSTTIRAHIRSEDSTRLSEDWDVNLHLLANDRLLLDYEADVSTLSEHVRTQLTANSSTAALDRVRFDFERGGVGRAVLFHSGGKPSDGLVWFDFKPSCAPPVDADAKRCTERFDTIQPSSAAVMCAASAITSNQPLLYSLTLVGKSTLDIHLGTLASELASAGRKRFFELQTSKTNQGHTEIRRCGSLHKLDRCPAPVGVGAVCIECLEPDAWRNFCNEYP